MKKLTNIKYILIIVISSGWLIYVFGYSQYLKYNRNKNGVQTLGTITKIRASKSGFNGYIHYKFNVGNLEYKGSTKTDVNKVNPHLGDTCFILFDSNNPDNNNLIRDSKNRILLKPVNKDCRLKNDLTL